MSNQPRHLFLNKNNNMVDKQKLSIDTNIKLVLLV